MLQIALSPHGRYLYYQPKGYPSPLVQYDVKTGKKKAICFLQDYYFERYGYWMGGQVYGMEISKDGSFVVIICDNYERSIQGTGEVLRSSCYRCRPDPFERKTGMRKNAPLYDH